MIKKKHILYIPIVHLQYILMVLSWSNIAHYIPVLSLINRETYPLKATIYPNWLVVRNIFPYIGNNHPN